MYHFLKSMIMLLLDGRFGTVCLSIVVRIKKKGPINRIDVLLLG